MSPYTFIFTYLLLSAALAQISEAKVCVKIGTRDTLEAEDQQVAKRMFERSLEKLGEEVTTFECSHQYVLTHVQGDDYSIMVTVSSPKGEHAQKINHLEEIRGAYQSILQGIFSDDQASTSARSSAREAPSAPQVAKTETSEVGQRPDVSGRASSEVASLPNRSHYQLTLGTRMPNLSAVDVGLGYRHDISRFGIDFSASVYTHNPVFTQATLSGLYYLNKTRSLFIGVGGGVSNLSGNGVSGSGPHLSTSLGYALHCPTWLCISAQTQILIPLYEIESNEGFDVAFSVGLNVAFLQEHR